MGRKPKIDRQTLANAALRIASAAGPSAVTVGALVREVGAPTGSFYHRYASREQLLAELWMDVVEAFQQGFVACLDEARDIDGAIEAARFMAAWTREHPEQARVLLLHRRQDFVSGEWPASLVGRAAALEPHLGAALRAFGRRVFGVVDRDILLKLRFALLDAPLGGIRPYVQSGTPIPAALLEALEVTARAVLGSIEPGPPPEAT